MAVASESLQIVRQRADGTYEWQGHPLSQPGQGGPALLADLLASDLVDSSEFVVTASAEWVATVEGITYNVLPGVIPDTGRFVFIGIAGGGGKAAVGNPDDVRAKFTSVGSLTAVVDSTVPAAFNGAGALTATAIAVQPPGPYDDNFNRPDGDPGIWWTAVTQALSYGTAKRGKDSWEFFAPRIPGGVTILNHELTTTVADKEQYGIWNNPLTKDDHKAQVIIGLVVPEQVQLAVRVSEADGHVRATFLANGQATLESVEGDLILGTPLQRDDLASGTPLAPGMVPSLEASGTEYVAMLDGIEVMRWSDTGVLWDHVDATHRQVAIGLKTAVAGVGAIDNFLAEDLGGARFTGDGALTATVVSSQLPQIKDARLSGTGVLLARLRGFTRNPRITADFSGEGALSSPLRQPYADDFNRPDGPPGDQWTVWHDAGLADLFVLGNEMVTTNDANEQHGWWNLALPTPNHSVEITVGSAVAAEYFLLVRAASSGGVATTYVQARLFTTDGSVELNSKDVDLTRRASLSSGPSLVTGQVIRFEAVGDGTTRSRAGIDGLSAEIDGRATAAAEYVLYVDEVEILRWSDTALAWPHVDDLHRNVDVGMQGTGSLDNFKATDLDAALPPGVANFSGSGTLSATAEEASLEPKPQFSGGGSLTARLTTYPKPISHFTFYEGSGVCARSLVGGYRLDLNDADTGWHGKAIKGPTWGVVGEPGVNNEWSVALQLTYNSATSDGPAILENHYEASTTHFSVGFDKRGGAAYPGVFVPTAVAGSQWVYSPTPIPLGTPHTLVCTCSVTDAAAKLYLDGVEILTVAGQTLIHRDFANSASLFDYSFNPDAYLDEVTYWDVCLTPEDVADLPPAIETPMSDFDFRERTGPTAASLLGSYTLAAADPVTAWDNASAVAPFTGVVGTGAADEWTVALDLTLESVLAGLSIVESAGTVIGLLHTSGSAFPGLQVAGGTWQFSTTGLPLGTPRKLVCVGSGAATTLYLDGMPVVTAAAQARDFAAATTLLDDQSAASVDNVSYWDVALSPEEVAGLSPIGPSRFTPISNFDFREGEGATAASTRGAYVLAATDPATAWKGQEAQGEFTGVVGKGALSKWSMAMTLTLNAVGTADEVIEEARESSGILTFALGFRYTGGQAFPGFYCTRSGVGAWSYSTTPFPLGSPYTLAFVSDQSDAFSGCRLYLNGGIVFEDDTYMTYRYYGEPTLLMGPEKPDASVDNVTYWDIALTPAEVADIPEPVEPPLPPKTADAQFSGGGVLGQETTRASMANFDFHEAGGDTAHSLVGDYTLTATDPDTAWHEASAAGRFDGVVGTGTQAEWSALFSLTLNAVNTTDGPSRLEMTYDDLGEYQSCVGFNHVGGVAYPGLQLGLDPWVYAATPFSVDVVHQLVVVGSAEAGTTVLYLDGVEVLSLPKADNARYFDESIRLMDDGYEQDAWLDNATYLDFALTPEEVAAIPSNHVIARLGGEGTLEAFVEDYAWYHDDFNRPDGPPGDSWQLTHTTPATADLVISGNELTVSGVNETEFGWWNRALPSPDHKVEVRVGRNIPSFIKLMVRSSQTNGWAEAQFNTSTGQVWICTFEGAWMGIGGVAERDERSGFTIADGTLISMEVIGPHYTARVNGAVAGHWYDIMNEWPHNDASHVNVGVSVQGPLGSGVDYFKATDLTGEVVKYPVHGTDDFDRPDGPLGANWTVKHIWETLTATVKNGQLWHSGNGTTQYIWAAPLPGDDMSIEFTVGDDPANGYLIRLRYGDNLWSQVKSNVNMMTPPAGMGMEEYMGPSIATQGGPTDGGLSRGSDAWDPAIDPGSTILFEAVGQWYVISVDGRQRWSWKDTGGEVPIGADRRHVLVELIGSTDPAYAEATFDNVVVTSLDQPVDETAAALDVAPTKKAPAKAPAKRAPKKRVPRKKA